MKTFSIADRLKSFTFAFAGIGSMLRTQHNAWLHLVSTVAVVAAGFWFWIDRAEWVWLILAIVAVWVAEALNTAFEFLCDVASPEFHPLVKHAKDVAAAAVLIASIGATIIGLMVFIPYIIPSF